MIADFLRRLSGAPDPTPLPPEDCRLALAALCVRLARSDGRFAAEERATIVGILQGRYSLDDTAAQALCNEGAELEEKAGDTVRLTKLIKDTVPYENRIEIVEALPKTSVGKLDKKALRTRYC